MTTFVDNLMSMNRKERYYLLRQAIGGGSFDLCENLLAVLNSALRIEVPPDAYVAMDYHMNWIYAALVLTYQPRTDNIYPIPAAPADSEARVVTGDQEDIDLIVAFERDGMNHLLMIEAKGVTRWSPKVLRHKADRLQAIFSSAFRESVKPYFLVASPFPPPPLPGGRWPDWWELDANRRPQWLHLDVDHSLLAVTRCGENGKPDASGSFWTLKRGISRPRSQFRWTEGDVAGEHFIVTYEERPGPLLRIGRGNGRTFQVQFEPAWYDLDYRARERVIRDLDFFLVEKGEPNPWTYAGYHCGTAANAYSDVHWGFVPTEGRM